MDLSPFTWNLKKFKIGKNITTTWKSILCSEEQLRLWNVVKCRKYSLEKLANFIYLYYGQKSDNHLILLIIIFLRVVKCIQNLPNLEGYIFYSLQHFTTKLRNFSKRGMLFQAMVIFCLFLIFFKILSERGKVHWIRHGRAYWKGLLPFASISKMWQGFSAYNLQKKLHTDCILHILQYFATINLEILLILRYVFELL